MRLTPAGSSAILLTIMSASTWTNGARAEEPPAFRPPAVPLVAHDPYFSVWSMTDRLTDDWSRHWTGSTQAICGLTRIDDKPYRFMGALSDKLPAMTQTAVEVWPTRTIYRFEAGGTRLTLTFCSPLLVNDLDVLGRSVTYVTFDVQATDGRPHRVALYLDCSPELAVNTADQKVIWSRYKIGDLAVLRLGSQEQPILAKSGDNLRIDWGWLYLAVPGQEGADTALAADRAARQGFVESGRLPEADDLRMPRAANDRWPVTAVAFDLGEIAQKPASRHLLLAYDDIYAIELLQRRLRPYWRRGGEDADALLKKAAKDYAPLMERCRAFDEELTADLTQVGGREYAQLCALAYRQCLAAHELAADFDGTPLMFAKENFSNGCIGTVDVIYPACPFFLLFNTNLLRANLRPVLDYAQSARWKWPFAPHDLGTYPLANGQVYGGGERTEENQMPVEETGNMLIMLAAMAKIDGNAEFAARYWPMLTKWAEYLKAKGLDPENQLCTDDFAGHLAHNANLSIKAIIAIGAYGQLCEMTGRKDQATVYRDEAKKMAGQWAKMAADGDHYKLAFDKPGTWSQKYNLVWDKLLGLHIFPPEIPRTEVAFYRTKMNK
ncbi:MAG: glutaminase domain-containing protein, partial [Phycisphaerae bacterium]